MTIIAPDEMLLLEVENPFEDEDSPFVIDMTDHADVEGSALRVELRRTRDPATGAVSPGNKLLDKHYIVGLISSSGLPEEGKNFRMPYHNFNNLTDFGNVDSQEPISNLLVDGDCYYFSTGEGQWRLKVLDAGN